MRNLAICYEYGKGCVENRNLAKKFYKNAAELEDPFGNDKNNCLKFSKITQAIEKIKKFEDN